VTGENRTGRIVRADGEHGARRVGPRLIDTALIELPAPVIRQQVRTRHHTIEACQMLEQRIARRRDEHVVSGGRAEKLEEHRVGFARTRRQHDSIVSNTDSTSGVVVRDGAARPPQAERLRSIAKAIGPGENAEQVARVFDTDRSRIRYREIEQRASFARACLDGQ
jgi:hypothetical protein